MSDNQLNSTTSNGTGWIVFAAIMMIMSGFFHGIAGLVALFKDTVFVVGTSHLVVADYTAWGWAHLLISALLIVSALSLLAGRLWGRIIGITLASLSALANFAFIPAYPLWSIMIIVFDIFIIYSIAVHGGELKEE